MTISRREFLKGTSTAIAAMTCPALSRKAVGGTEATLAEATVAAGSNDGIGQWTRWAAALRRAGARGIRLRNDDGVFPDIAIISYDPQLTTFDDILWRARREFGIGKLGPVPRDMRRSLLEEAAKVAGVRLGSVSAIDRKTGMDTWSFHYDATIQDPEILEAEMLAYIAEGTSGSGSGVRWTVDPHTGESRGFVETVDGEAEVARRQSWYDDPEISPRHPRTAVYDLREEAHDLFDLRTRKKRRRG